MKYINSIFLRLFVICLHCVASSVFAQDSLIISANPQQYAVFETHDANLMVISHQGSVLIITKTSLDGNIIFQQQHPFSYNISSFSKDNISFKGKKNFLINTSKDFDSSRIHNTVMVNEAGNILWQRLDTVFYPDINFYEKNSFKQTDSTVVTQNRLPIHVWYDGIDGNNGSMLFETVPDTFGGTVNNIFRSDGSFITFFNTIHGFYSIRHFADGSFDSNWDTSIHLYPAAYSGISSAEFLRFYEIVQYENHYRLAGEYLGRTVFVDVDTNGQLMDIHSLEIFFNNSQYYFITAAYDEEFTYVVSRQFNSIQDKYVLSAINQDFNVVCQKQIVGAMSGKKIVKLFDKNYLPLEQGNNQLLYVELSGCLGGLTGIDEQNVSDNLQIYPNPSSDLVQIKADGNIIYEVEVIDVSGRTRMLQKFQAENVGLDISALVIGMYYMKIKTIKGTATKQLVKAGQ